MPLTIHEIQNYDEHQNLMNSLHDKIVYCWYVAAKIPSTGQSWCGDCRETEPVIRNYLDQLKIKDDLEVHIIYTELERDYFKGSDCDFRHDPKIQLQKVPTLFNPKDRRALIELECKEKEKLDKFFQDIRS